MPIFDKKLRVGGTIMAPEQFVVPHYENYYIPVCSLGLSILLIPTMCNYVGY